MLYNNNNHARDDSVFGVRVLDAVLRRGGDGALVRLWRDYCQLREAARNNNDDDDKDDDDAVNYVAFVQLLRTHGATLDDVHDAAYLCKAFDDKQSGHISTATFFRHLTSMNGRRRDAVLRAWSACIAATCADGSRSSNENYDNDDNDDTHAIVTASAMCAQHARCAVQTCEHAALTRCFAASSPRADEDGNDKSSRDEVVDVQSFLAYYAGVSRRTASDEAFQLQLLREWAADDVTRPVMHRTVHEQQGSNSKSSGANTATAATITTTLHDCTMQHTRSVAEALRTELGRSSRTYNYTHAQRVHPPIDPLPPLDRDNIMRSTTQCDYVAYTAPAARTLADPLVTRRGQLV